MRPCFALITRTCGRPSLSVRSVARKVLPSTVPSRLKVSTKIMPPLPGNSVKRPASSPAAITDLFAAAMTWSAVRADIGPSQSETRPTTMVESTASRVTGRSMPRGPMPDEASTCISLSRYMRPRAIRVPRKADMGSKVESRSTICKPSTSNITLGWMLPLATFCNTVANAPPAKITSSTMAVASTPVGKFAQEITVEDAEHLIELAVRAASVPAGKP